MKGFTTIELIVSIVILMLLIGLTIAGYNSFSDRQAVVQASRTLKNNLREAQTKARAGLKPAGCDSLLGYQAAFTSTTQYTIAAFCDIGGLPQTAGPVDTFELPSGVTFGAVPATMIFYTLHQGVTQSQTITLTGNLKTVQLQVSTEGTIYDVVPTPTP